MLAIYDELISMDGDVSKYDANIWRLIQHITVRNKLLRMAIGNLFEKVTGDILDQFTKVTFQRKITDNIIRDRDFLNTLLQAKRPDLVGLPNEFRQLFIDEVLNDAQLYNNVFQDVGLGIRNYILKIRPIILKLLKGIPELHNEQLLLLYNDESRLKWPKLKMNWEVKKFKYPLILSDNMILVSYSEKRFLPNLITDGIEGIKSIIFPIASNKLIIGRVSGGKTNIDFDNVNSMFLSYCFKSCIAENSRSLDVGETRVGISFDDWIKATVETALVNAECTAENVSKRIRENIQDHFFKMAME